MEYFDNRIIRTTIFVFVVALILRTGYSYFFIDPEYLILEDQGGYVQLGQSIAKTGDFFQLTDGKHTGRLPGYPTFLAIIYTLFGENNMAVVVVQTIIDSLTCVVIGLIAKSVIPRSFLVVGMISALNLNMIIHSGMILTDTLFLFLFSIFILFAFYYLRHPARLKLFLAISFLAIATLVRPVSYFLIMLVLLLLIVRFILKRIQLKEIMYNILIFLIPIVIAFGAIHQRNYYEYNSFSLVNQGGVHALKWVVPAVYQYSGQGSYQDGQKFAQKHLELSTKKSILDNIANNPFKSDDYYMKAAKKALSELGLLNMLHAWSAGAVINLLSPSVASAPSVRSMEHPSFYETPGKGVIEKLVNYVTNTDGLTYLLIITIGTIISMMFLITSFFGLYKMIRSEWFTGVNREIIIFSLVVIIYFVAITGPIVGVKYRLPFEPILTMFIAYLFVKFKTKNTRI